MKIAISGHAFHCGSNCRPRNDRYFAIVFSSGGGEAVESAWKVAKQYFKLRGKPLKHKVISRMTAYHGTPHGALAITGCR